MPQENTLSRSLERNIEVLEERERRDAKAATRQDRLAEAITRFTGSMNFVYLHLALYGAWIAINLGAIWFIPAFDPAFTVLTIEVSVEAIFLSTFVLISQNRSSVVADRRADLALHITLLTEDEVTKLASLVAAIAERLDVHQHAHPDIEEIRRDVAPEQVLDALCRRAEEPT